MNKYAVHFKNKKTDYYFAFSYTEKEGKYIFHKREDKSDSDSDSFAFVNDVRGIDNLGEGEEPVGIHLG